MKVWQHFRTITRHRHKVIVGCAKCGILWQGLLHDLSKYSPTEFIPGAKYYLGTRSPNEAEREAQGYSLAWMHHKGRNRHHFEYWFDYNRKTKRMEPVKMPARYVAEMFCDRMAASKVYQGKDYRQDSALIYFQNSRARKNGMFHPETEQKLGELLTILAEKGEKEACREVRKLVKNGY